MDALCLEVGEELAPLHLCLGRRAASDPVASLDGVGYLVGYLDPDSPPPRETAKEEDTPPATAEESTPEPERAQTPPPEVQEDARWPTHTLSGEMLTFDFGPLALGPRRVHLALMFEW